MNLVGKDMANSGDLNTLELIENRVERLEKLIGKSDKLDDTQVTEILTNINQKLIPFKKNIKIDEAFNRANEVKKLTNVDLVTELNEDLSAKMELVLKEEELIKTIDEDYDRIKKLSQVLDSDALNNVPTLIEKLQEISAKKEAVENEIEAHADEVKQFLTNYYSTMKAIGESLAEFTDFVKVTSNKDDN